MPASTEPRGPRLEFVLRELPGTVTREITIWDKESATLAKKKVIEPAGYMLYLPDGHSYRLSADEVRRRNYFREPELLNAEKAKDKKTPAGRFMLAVTEAARKKAYSEMEEEIEKVCRSFAGPVINQISDYDPKGKVTDGRSAA